MNTQKLTSLEDLKKELKGKNPDAVRALLGKETEASLFAGYLIFRYDDIKIYEKYLDKEIGITISFKKDKFKSVYLQSSSS